MLRLFLATLMAYAPDCRLPMQPNAMLMFQLVLHIQTSRVCGLL